MASIGEQIIAARKAKGMTQEALSRALNVSRTTVSNWEIGRRLPDAETLLRLSRLLDYSFETGAARPPEPVSALQTEPEDIAPRVVTDAEEEPGPAPAEEAPSEQTVAEQAPPTAKPARARRWMIACAAAAVVVCVLVALWLHARHGAATPVYRDAEGNAYTFEQFKAETPRQEGKAWLSAEKIVKVQQGDGFDMWMYDFKFHELNGVGLTIDRLEVYTFAGENVHPQILDKASLQDFDIETTIAPSGDWGFTGGLPVQEKVSGIGVKLITTDDTGTSQTFTSFLKLNAVQ